MVSLSQTEGGKASGKVLINIGTKVDAVMEERPSWKGYGRIIDDDGLAISLVKIHSLGRLISMYFHSIMTA